MSDVLPTRTLWGWGYGRRGQLGDDNAQDRSSPVSVAGGFVDWIQVATERNTGVVAGLRENGTLWTWGNDWGGLLGDGVYATSERSSPTEVLGGFTDWVHVSLGHTVSLAVRRNGTLWGWGEGVFGALGYNGAGIVGSGGDRASPVNIGSVYSDWVSGAAGAFWTFGIRSNGTLWAQGQNWTGALADGTIIDRSSPVKVLGDFTDWESVDSGWYSNVALRKNGTLWSWGYNFYGEVGDGTTELRSSPVSVLGGYTDWIRATTGFRATGGIRANGTILRWGDNQGTMGYTYGVDAYEQKSSPVSITNSTDWIDFSVGGHTSQIGLKADGTIWTWGPSNNVGQLGHGHRLTETVWDPVQVVGGFTDVVSVVDGELNMFVLRGNPIPEIPDGSTIWTWGRGKVGEVSFENWGNDASGQLGRPVDFTRDHPYINFAKYGTMSRSPTLMAPEITDWIDVFAGTAVMFGLRGNKTLWSWGMNYDGQRAIGNTVTDYRTNHIPQEVLGGFTDWSYVALHRGFHIIGLRENGTLWGWGINNFGALGDGTVENRSSPTPVLGGFTDWKQCSVGYEISFGIRENGTLWGWGRNNSEQLGLDTGNNFEASPILVGGGFSDWVFTSGQWGIRNEGELWGWGQNHFNRFLQPGWWQGYGVYNSPSPISIPTGFTDWDRVVYAGLNTVMALRKNGTLWGWGLNDNGQLGDGTTIDRSSPVEVLGGFTDWIDVGKNGPSWSQFTALRSNGTLWTWGFQGPLQGVTIYQGPLGDGTTIDRSSPVSVIGGLTNWKSLGRSFSLTGAILSKSDPPVSEIWRSAYPLIANESVNRVQELPLGDSLNLQGSSILNVEAINGQVISTTSDSRKKDSVHTLEHAGDLVDALRGVTFKWKKNDSDSMGLIAQEVEEVIPEVVHTSESGKSLSYGNMIGLLVEALKEQDIDILEIENMIKDMEGDKNV